VTRSDSDASVSMSTQEDKAEAAQAGAPSVAAGEPDLQASGVLNLECRFGFGLVVYIHDAVDLDPATGAGKAIVEVSYKSSAPAALAASVVVDNVHWTSRHRGRNARWPT